MEAQGRWLEQGENPMTEVRAGDGLYSWMDQGAGGGGCGRNSVRRRRLGSGRQGLGETEEP